LGLGKRIRNPSSDNDHYNDNNGCANDNHDEHDYYYDNNDHDNNDHDNDNDNCATTCLR
jgi:hypothetical protein